MSRVFLKVFLGLWGVMLLVVIVSVTLVVDRLEARLVDLPRIARAIDETLAADGVEGLRRWLRSPEAVAPGVRLLVLDENGRDVLGRPPPADSQSWIDRLRDRRRRQTLAHAEPLRFIAPDGTGLTLRPVPIAPAPFERVGIGSFRAAIFVIAGLASALLCALLAHTLTAPVRALGGATRRLAAGNLSARVGAPVTERRDELGSLARDFDQMAERLQETLEVRQRVLRDVSHELRSPLTRIRLALELAAHKGRGAEAELKRIEAETVRLDGMIGQILTLARLDEGNEIKREAFQLDEIVDLVAQDAAFEARPRNASVELVGCDPIELQGDPDLMRSALENLVRNGVRFTPEGSKLELSLQRDPGAASAVVEVRDHGPGLPPDELDRIFEPFFKSSSHPAASAGDGAGVGLAIALRVVGIHGGSIAADNAPGGGLRIRVTLPLG